MGAGSRLIRPTTTSRTPRREPAALRVRSPRRRAAAAAAVAFYAQLVVRYPGGGQPGLVRQGEAGQRKPQGPAAP